MMCTESLCRLENLLQCQVLGSCKKGKKKGLALRKTFGRHIYENASTNGELALVMLSELFNHSNIAITKRYLGIRKDEILGCYDLLDF